MVDLNEATLDEWQRKSDLQARRDEELKEKKNKKRRETDVEELEKAVADVIIAQEGSFL